MKRALKIFALFMFFLLPNYQLSGGQDLFIQNEVEAAFIYNFIKFIEWPERSGSDKEKILIGVLGKGEIQSAMSSLNGKEVEGKEIIVKKIGSLNDILFLDILYISPSEKKKIGSILKELNGSNTLTISHLKGFAKQGGIINFYIEDDKVNFQINLKEADKAKLKISSKLLRLAKIVETKE